MRIRATVSSPIDSPNTTMNWPRMLNSVTTTARRLRRTTSLTDRPIASIAPTSPSTIPAAT